MQSVNHQYGDNVHICSNPYWLSILNRFSTSEFQQPYLNHMVRHLYGYLLGEAMATCLPRKNMRIPTRMSEITDKAYLEGEMVDPESKIVVVDLARAGILPTLVCFENLCSLVRPELVRQDHFYINRRTNQIGEVVGVDVSGSKVGGPVDDAWVLFPDPMGATGGSLSYAIGHYKDKIEGKAKGYIALHLIVTPEYLKRMKNDHPDVHVFAFRLDRGLSDEQVLSSTPGAEWDKERGLTDKHYIVPGAGGVGEVLNNSYV